jgi:hypothetical protein
MADRPGLGRDDSYNRVTVSRDLKSQIMDMINDSSESLPLHNIQESDDEDDARASSKTGSTPNTGTGGSAAPGAGSKLATESMSPNDFATPTPEKPNPLEKVPTVRSNHDRSNRNSLTVPGSESDTDFATASPMRSHDWDGPELGKLGKRISRMVTHSQTDVSGEKARDHSADGTTTSRATTASQTPSHGGAPSRPGMDKRQSTMKRITSAFKRTASKNQ